MTECTEQLFIRTEDGKLYRVHEDLGHCYAAVPEEYWLDDKGSIAIDPVIKLVNKNKVKLVHENLSVVEIGICDPEDQQSIIKLEELAEIGEEYSKRFDNGISITILMNFDREMVMSKTNKGKFLNA